MDQWWHGGGAGRSGRERGAVVRPDERAAGPVVALGVGPRLRRGVRPGGPVRPVVVRVHLLALGCRHGGHALRPPYLSVKGGRVACQGLPSMLNVTNWHRSPSRVTLLMPHTLKVTPRRRAFPI